MRMGTYVTLAPFAPTSLNVVRTYLKPSLKLWQLFPFFAMETIPSTFVSGLLEPSGLVVFIFQFDFLFDFLNLDLLGRLQHSGQC